MPQVTVKTEVNKVLDKTTPGLQIWRVEVRSEQTELSLLSHLKKIIMLGIFIFVTFNTPLIRSLFYFGQKMELVLCPPKTHGQFYEGDSYLILSVCIYFKYQ